jgi:AcrR family transcriptional regulator
MTNKIKFERESVIRTASHLFWKKGFNATSTRDLQDAINLRPGSIYSAFGSKEGLYCESLKDYTEQMKAQIDACLLGADSVLEGLREFVEKVIIANKACDPSAICMLVKANNEFTDTSSQLYELSQQLSAKFEAYLTSLFEQAIKNGELNSQYSGLDYARFFQVQFTGLRAYLNRPEGEQTAQAMIAQMFALITSLRIPTASSSTLNSAKSDPVE